MSHPRREAREAALQILYFWELSHADLAVAIGSYFAEHQPNATADVRIFAETLVRGTVADLEAIDALIVRHSAHWRLERLAVVDRLILRMAVWELRHELETPQAVVLNEAVELARRFSTEDAVRFVNGVLDAIRQALAPAS